MKKLMLIVFCLIILSIASCSKEDIGNDNILEEAANNDNIIDISVGQAILEQYSLGDMTYYYLRGNWHRDDNDGIIHEICLDYVKIDVNALDASYATPYMIVRKFEDENAMENDKEYLESFLGFSSDGYQITTWDTINDILFKITHEALSDGVLKEIRCVKDKTVYRFLLKLPIEIYEKDSDIITNALLQSISFTK